MIGSVLIAFSKKLRVKTLAAIILTKHRFNGVQGLLCHTANFSTGDKLA